MVKNRTLARSISRAGWRQIRTMCEAKSNMIHDREVRTISRWEPTSQICSCCGYRWGKLDLSVRSVLCLNCGTEHDRDKNASANILAAGQADLNGQALSSVRPHNEAVACLPTQQESA
ncbi:RNA-guided endonuclease InsQ/TnpB family protein [Leptodesmis sp.]|uniref:RNA-guided endonuclease InsQ/TnpB family protein n=1 Tax=Leptodesmis sp. TaxID=3100501 RepID=UPI0040535A88